MNQDGLILFFFFLNDRSRRFVFFQIMRPFFTV